MYHCNFKKFLFFILNSSYFPKKYNPEVTYYINVFKKVKIFQTFVMKKELSTSSFS